MTKEEKQAFARQYNCPLNRVELVNILMNRDEVSFANAMDSIDECVEDMASYLRDGKIIAAMEVVMDNLGLEANYGDYLTVEVRKELEKRKADDYNKYADMVNQEFGE